MLTIPLSWVYGFASRIFHERYDKFPFLQYKTTIPVVSVGNLTAGGTGKTPFVIALSKLLMRMNPELSKPDMIAVLSRGYGRLSKKLIEVRADSRWEDSGDEPILIKRNLASSAVIVHADRRQSSAYAINRLGSKILLLDDGFQHRALARNLDLVLLAGDYPLGNGWRLPAGPLRESSSALKRASIIFGIGKETGEAAAVAARFELPFASASPKYSFPSELPKSSPTKVLVLTSIANPSRLIAGCEGHGLQLCGRMFYPDHHAFQAADLEKINREIKRTRAEVVLTTEKDQIRLGGWTSDVPLKTVGYALEIQNEDVLISVLEPIVGHMGLT